MKVRPKTNWFDTRKAAQIAAYFIAQEGGRIPVLKLVKLIYLADRACMDEYDFPMTYDQLVSMEHGPVNSTVLNCINGMRANQEEWDAIIADRDGHDVGLAHPDEKPPADRLNRAELKILERVWNDFGKMSKFEIRDWTHKNCKEWVDPDGSSIPIPYEYLFKFLDKDNADELADQVYCERGLLASLAAS